ncbi:hypothetical protein SAMD00019534_107200, partial [Acytostelium subglobosum LB1]|uniref:hypothetical protein n=1 Tax=Acytostelium subglobosum LB1 TaxID=1410327 RepID=UPI000644CED0
RMNDIKCLLFAKVKELMLGDGVAVDHVIVKLPVDSCDTNSLIANLKTQYPSASNLLDVCMVAINLEYIEKGTNAVIKPTDEVAIIPPVSGG